MPRASALSALGCTLFSVLLSALDAAPCSAESLAAPRPITPMSLGDVTQMRPTLRWNLPAGSDGAVVELCRDRACQFVIETLRANGTSVRPPRDLPSRSVVFWRLRATVGAVIHPAVSATWLFHVPARDAAGCVDSSAHAHLDVNGDGYSTSPLEALLQTPPAANTLAPS